MGLGYRIISSGTTSIHYSGVVNIIAAAAVTIHLSFGLNENENQHYWKQRRTEEQWVPTWKESCWKQSFTSTLLYNGGWPTLLIGLAQKGSHA